MSAFRIEDLPFVDQREIKRGRCPWCLGRLAPADDGDECAECDDTFIGRLTIED